MIIIALKCLCIPLAMIGLIYGLKNDNLNIIIPSVFLIGGTLFSLVYRG